MGAFEDVPDVDAQQPVADAAAWPEPAWVSPLRHQADQCFVGGVRSSRERPDILALDDLPTQAGTVASDGRVAKCVATAQISLTFVSVPHCQDRWRFSEFGHWRTAANKRPGTGSQGAAGSDPVNPTENRLL